MKTDMQIAAEVAALKDLRYKVRAFTMFGDSNIRGVGAQIQVLEDGLTEDDCYDEWADGDDEGGNAFLRDNALAARAWRDDDDNYDHPDSLADEWRPLVVRR